MKMTRRLVVGLLLAAMTTPALADGTTVFAAASMKNALDAIVARYSRETGKSVKVSYGASGALAKQLEAGAPADIFVTADEKWFGYVADKGIVDARSRVTLAGNKLVLVVAAESKFPYKGKDLTKFIGDDRIAVGEPKSVPCGAYTVEALTALKQWDEVAPKAVYADNVRAVLEVVARGEAIAGVVYETDAKVEPRVKVAYTFAEETHKPIVYPAGLTRDAGAEGKAFFKYLGGKEALAELKAQGFTKAN